MKRSLLLPLIPALFLLGLIAAKMCCYTLDMTEQAIITQFGKPVGKPIASAGLHFKMPLVQVVNRLEKRTMEWENQPEQVPTADKLFIFVDTYARWRIADPLLFFQSLTDERLAQSRLDDVLDGETRNEVAKHQLIELVRTDKERHPREDPSLSTATMPVEVNWQPIRLGRETIAKAIKTNAEGKLASMGIELIDIRFKRINYNDEVQRRIYDRMISERKQIAEKFRSEGQGEAARISGDRELKLRQVESEAYRTVQEIQGKADAQAMDIYAQAYNQSAAAADFFQFSRTMETYLTTLDQGTTLILSTQGDFLKFLKGVNPGGTPAVTAPAPAEAKPGPAPAAAPAKAAAAPTTATATRR